MNMNFSAPPTLQHPPDIYPLLTERGVNPNLARDISSKYLSHVSVLQQQILKFYNLNGPAVAQLQDLLQKLPNAKVRPPPNINLQSFYSSVVDHLVQMAVKAADEAKSIHGAAHPPPTRPSGRTPSSSTSEFNQSYTPHLLKYFSLYPHPSRTCKKLLAEKSGMSARQIEVWFQNRRRRLGVIGKAREEDEEKEIKFIKDELPEWRDLMQQDQEPERLRQPEDPKEKAILDPLMDAQKYKSCTARLTHQPYKRQSQDPFFTTTSHFPHSLPSHSNERMRFPAPVWPRARSPFSQSMSRDGDVRSLRKAFLLLSVKDEKDKVESRGPPAATFAITVVPEKAPLPSLIRRTEPVTKTVRRSSSSSVGTSHRSPSMQAPKKTKKSGPPRRVPTSSRREKEASSFNPPSPPIRMPSLSPPSSRTPSASSSSRSPSPTPSLRRSSSSSSLSSSSSYSPSTPSPSTSPQISIAGLDFFDSPPLPLPPQLSSKDLDFSAANLDFNFNFAFAS